jgi:hypothetical protein
VAVSPKEEIIAAEDEARFVMSFVAESDKTRDPYKDIWRETLQNYLVRPWDESIGHQQVQYPYLTENRSTTGRARLKDPESNQIVESLLAEVMNLIYPETSFIRAKPVGYEDAFKATTVQKLLQYVFRREGHYRSLLEWKKDGFIFGTGIIEGYWLYREGQRRVRSLAYDGGVETSTEQVVPFVVHDDYRLRNMDLLDFFPDPGRTRIGDMLGVAKRFTTYAREARTNPNYDKSAVERAIVSKGAEDSREQQDKSFREYADRPSITEQKPHPDFMPLVGYCYYGEVPYKHRDGAFVRRVEILNGELVRSEPFYGRLPFFEFTVCPIQGRFYGLSPLEVARYTQDFADGLLMDMADAANRAVDPPHIVQRDSGIDMAKLRRFSGRVPVLSDSVEAVQQIPYNPQIQHASAIYQLLKSHMREGSGALGALQGLGLGVDRASATEASGTFQQAKGRPEALARLAEREYLPPIAQHALSQNQEYLESSEDLVARVGSDPQPALLSDIMGEFDIEMTGSRVEGTRSETLAAYREWFSLGANPMAAPFVPWGRSLQRFAEKLGLHEEAAEVGQAMMLQAALTGSVGPPPDGAGFGNGNGELPSNPPPDQGIAQTSGAALG